MKWTYSIKNKIAASIALLSLCLLVLLSNYLDRIHTQNVKNSIATLYEDRLIADDYILKMTNNIYQIREVLNSTDSNNLKSNAINQLIADFNHSYNIYIKTKLTATENATAIELINSLKNFEQKNSNNNYEASNHTGMALTSLSKLSSIQLDESKLIMKNAEAEYANIKTTSQLAFAIIIIILLVLQAIVFSAKTLMPVNLPSNPSLN